MRPLFNKYEVFMKQGGMTGDPSFHDEFHKTIHAPSADEAIEQWFVAHGWDPNKESVQRGKDGIGWHDYFPIKCNHVVEDTFIFVKVFVRVGDASELVQAMYLHKGRLFVHVGEQKVGMVTLETKDINAILEDKLNERHIELDKATIAQLDDMIAENDALNKLNK